MSLPRRTESLMVVVPVALLVAFVVFMNGGVDASLRAADSACRSAAMSVSAWVHHALSR
jgi:hypothetical protein